MKKIGMYNAYLNTRGGGEKVFLAAASYLSKDYELEIITHVDADLKSLANFFNVDIADIKLIVIPTNTLFHKLVDKLIIIGSFRDLVKDYYLSKKLKKRDYDIFINNTYHSNLANPGEKGIYMCMFPQKLERAYTKNPIKLIYRHFLFMLQRVFLFSGKNQGIDTYNIITANSKYTQSYIKKIWHKDSKILYPICDSMLDKSIKKEKIILNVGRFFDSEDKVAHHKRQDILLDSFIDGNFSLSGWELHFAGSVSDTKETKQYIANLQKKSKNLPVYFHFDASFNELKTLYNQAAIYWHATGYGSNEGEFPEKQEHFGISTVEAMSAGAIPIVINTAGQKEIVTHGLNGFLWSAEEDLCKFTINGIAKNGKKMSDAAIENSRKFNRKNFNKNLHRIISSL